MIAGSRGFSHLVSTRNIDDHLKWHFHGRIGGELGERIPIVAMYHELRDFKERYHQIEKDTRLASLKVREQFSAERVFTLIEEEITGAVVHYAAVCSQSCFSLKPNHIKEEVRIQQEGPRLYLVERHNKVLRQLSSEEGKILVSCNGNKNIAEIADERGSDLEGTVSFIRELWYQKVLYFS
jgi:hypothetical protein